MRMRICGLLLAPAALCLLGGVLGVGISHFCLGLPDKQDDDAGRVGLVASGVLLILGGISLSAALAGTPPDDRPAIWWSFLRWGVVAALMVIPTGLLFGPSGGFHHHIGFGPFPFFYMVWNGEDPAPGSFQIVAGYEVWFDPLLFGILVAIWMAMFAGAVRLIRPLRRASMQAGPSPNAVPGAV